MQLYVPYKTVAVFLLDRKFMIALTHYLTRLMNSTSEVLNCRQCYSSYLEIFEVVVVLYPFFQPNEKKIGVFFVDKM